MVFIGRKPDGINRFASNVRHWMNLLMPVKAQNKEETANKANIKIGMIFFCFMELG